MYFVCIVFFHVVTMRILTIFRSSLCLNQHMSQATRLLKVLQFSTQGKRFFNVVRSEVKLIYHCSFLFMYPQESPVAINAYFACKQQFIAAIYFVKCACFIALVIAGIRKYVKVC